MAEFHRENKNLILKNATLLHFVWFSDDLTQSQECQHALPLYLNDIPDQTKSTLDLFF